MNSILAIAQPILTSTPAKIAGEWFSTSERDIATVLCSLFNPIGNGVGQVCVCVFHDPLLLSIVFNECVLHVCTLARTQFCFSHGIRCQALPPELIVDGLPMLLLMEAGAATVGALWAYVALKPAPPTPPSHTAAE